MILFYNLWQIEEDLSIYKRVKIEMGNEVRKVILR